MPLEGMDRKAYRSAKFGSWERSQALDAQVASVGKANRIAFNYERVERPPTPSRRTG
jgi:predicted DsbA family dithiol-disulfide isomerase